MFRTGENNDGLMYVNKVAPKLPRPGQVPQQLVPERLDSSSDIPERQVSSLPLLTALIRNRHGQYGRVSGVAGDFLYAVSFAWAGASGCYGCSESSSNNNQPFFLQPCSFQVDASG